MEFLLPGVVLLTVAAAICIEGRNRSYYQSCCAELLGRCISAGSQAVLEFLPLGTTAAVTNTLLAQDNVISDGIPTGGPLPYSSGHVNTAYVSCSHASTQPSSEYCGCTWILLAMATSLSRDLLPGKGGWGGRTQFS